MKIMMILRQSFAKILKFPSAKQVVQSRFQSSSSAASNIKRFYKNVSLLKVTENNEQRFEIILDRKKLKTPKGNVFYVLNEPLASMIIAEWDSQKEKIIPSNMHLTTLANTVIDNPNNLSKDEYIDKLLQYFHFDTVCYRNPLPIELNELQTKKLDPIVQWFANQFQCSMPVTNDVQLPEIDSKTIEIMRKYLNSFNIWSLTGIMFATENLKSLILTCALIARQISIEQSVALSRIEENFQTQRWQTIEYHHDLEQFNIQSRIAAAMLFILLNLEKNVTYHKNI